MIIEQGSKVSIDKGKVIIELRDKKRSIPKETIDNVTIFGNVQLTTHFIRHCLTRNIPISYFSLSGKYFGRTSTIYGQDILKLKKQIELFDNPDFLGVFSYIIIEAKINNQLTVLRRYKHYNLEIINEIDSIIRLKNKLIQAKDIKVLLGYEGMVARHYFRALSMIMPEEFKFEGRSRRPPRDPFNSMISLGYTILLHEIIGQLENVGLSPYGGYIHGHSRKHPSLASDLIEEYRAIIVDSLVVSMILNGEVLVDDFNINSKGVFLKEDLLKKFLAKLQKKLFTKQKYLSYIDKPMTYRKTIYHQCKRLSKAIMKEDPLIYEPTRIR